MKKIFLSLCWLTLTAGDCTADEAVDIQAKTANGDQVVLHPNGKWEFVDSQKAGQAKAIANTFVENQGCPTGTQGGFFGFGRCVTPGDKDFNRGSLSGKGR